MGDQLSLFKITKRRKKDYSFTSNPSDIFPKGCFELSVSYRRRAEKRKKIVISQDVADFSRAYCYHELSIEHVESFFIILCDRGHHAYAYRKISEGGVHGTVVDPKVIFQI